MNEKLSSQSGLRNFLEIPYDELEQINLKNLEKARNTSPEEMEAYYREYLEKETRIKAVTICFSNIEGRLHMLDYDKKFLLRSSSNLTFDGSSIRGFSELAESDLRLSLDWTSLRHLPSDVFGPGKVILFAFVLNNDKTPHSSDFRSRLKEYSEKIKKEKGFSFRAAAEVEGFLLEGVGAEVNYDKQKGFELISTGGYYHSLPLDTLKIFIDRSAEAQRAMAFKNEKDHCEVAPSQFELNFSHEEVLRACDQIQLYKLTCRQIAANMNLTASFLPKPVANINGNGMHLNISLESKGKNIFYEEKGRDGLSKIAWDAISKILNHAQEISLILNSSVNAYRRLDPNFEAPNQIKVSSKDRGSMIRIPVANEHSARFEVRSVAPDSNPYLAFYAIMKTMLEGDDLVKETGKRDRIKFLPGNINDAIRIFKSSDFTTKLIGQETKDKYLSFKQAVADRSPKELGTIVKNSEVHHHHEVTNQVLWSNF